MGRIAGDRRDKRKSTRLRVDEYAASAGGSEELEQPDSDLLTPPTLTDDRILWPQLDANQDHGLTSLASDMGHFEFMDGMGPMRATNSFPSNEEFCEIDFLTSPNSLDNLSSPVCSQARSSALSSSGSTSMESTTLTSSTTKSQSTEILTTNIHDLSQKLSQSPLALDEVLSISTSYLQSIDSDIATLPADPSRMATVLMIIICLTQVLALFEECISPSTAKTLFDITSGPALLLGSFQVDLESQRQIRIHIVREALMRVFNVARDLLRALQQRPAAAGPQNQTYLTLVADVQRRVRFLAHTVNHS